MDFDLSLAIDNALTHGLLKRTRDGRITHCPFTLSPCPIYDESLRSTIELSQPYNRLIHAVARDIDFLIENLQQMAGTDPFIRDLLRIARVSSASQPLRFLVTRIDYFLQMGTGLLTPKIRLVEMNTISASYLGLARNIDAYHRVFLLKPRQGSLVENDPLAHVAATFAQVFSRYGYDNASVLMIVQKDESNFFDQRMVETALAAYDISMQRLQLDEIAERGRLHEGHLMIDGQIAAITYFRAGYGPEDLRSKSSLKARRMIEASSTIAVPDLPAQLAGTKKVQQLLTDPVVLRRFCSETDARRLQATFAGTFALEDSIQCENENFSAWEAAIDEPTRFVLKPQREGGGNNFYGENMRQKLRKLSPTERNAYILMERIYPVSHTATCVADGDFFTGSVVSEIGRFGVLLANGHSVLINEDAGYLVRTKREDATEGGLSAGHGHLDSLLLVESP